jgi:hypothetical protein
MGNTTEGIILTSHRGTHSPWGPQQGDFETRSIRSIFVENLHKAIGDLNDPHTPIGIKPALQRLLLECDHYLLYGNETIIIKLSLDAIEVCNQGWSFLSCWISSSENICYSIYWALKAALEQHAKNKLKEDPNGGDPSLTNDPAFPARMRL